MVIPPASIALDAVGAADRPLTEVLLPFSASRQSGVLDPLLPFITHAIIRTMTATVYVKLLDEGTDVWRPVVAEKVAEGLFRLVGKRDDSDEVWEFDTGSIVRVERRTLSSGSEIVAVELAN